LTRLPAVRQGACSEKEEIASEVTARCQFAMTKQSKLCDYKWVKLRFAATERQSKFCHYNRKWECSFRACSEKKAKQALRL